MKTSGQNAVSSSVWMFALAATRRSGGVRRLLLLTTAVRHASALTAVVALRAQSNLLPVRHRALRCAPALLAWEPPPGFKEWKEGDAPFDEEEDDRSFDMFDLVSEGPDRRRGSQRRASSAEEFVEAHAQLRRFRRLEGAGIDLRYISATSPLHLPYISGGSRRRG